MTRAGYILEADPRLWINVPIEFPTDEWTSAEQWADEIPARLASGLDETDERVAWFRGVTRAIVKVPLPNDAVRERFWYFPVDRPQVALAHLTLIPRDILGSEPLDDLALSGGPTRVAAPRLDRLESPVFGEVLRGLEAHESGAPQPEQGAPLDASAEPAVVGVVRLVGEASGMVFLLEVVDPDLAKIGEMLDDLEALFASIEISDTDAP